MRIRATPFPARPSRSTPDPDDAEPNDGDPSDGMTEAIRSTPAAGHRRRGHRIDRRWFPSHVHSQPNRHARSCTRSRRYWWTSKTTAISTCWARSASTTPSGSISTTATAARGTRSTWHRSGPSSACTRRLADLDGDGDLDVAAVGLFDRNVGFASQGEVTWYRNPREPDRQAGSPCRSPASPSGVRATSPREI